MAAPVVLYQYHPTLRGRLALGLLDGYQGYIQTDGYAGYDHLSKDPGIEHLGCMVHARRKFMDVNKSRKMVRGKLAKRKGLAEEALDYIGELYQIEKYARVNALSYGQILELRNQKASSILDRFKAWLDTHHRQVQPKSMLGKAIQYSQQ
jgi:transposase